MLCIGLNLRLRVIYYFEIIQYLTKQKEKAPNYTFPDFKLNLTR